MVVSVLDAPAGKTLEDIATDPATQQFLLARFGEDPAKWPKVEVTPSDVRVQEGDKPIGAEQPPPIPGLLLEAEGEARNLKGNLNPKSRGALLLTVAKGKLFRLRMYAWPSQWDDERIKDDCTDIEMSFEILDARTDKTAPKPSDGEGPDAPADGAAEEKSPEKAFESRVQRWKLLKPAGLGVREYSKEEQPNRQLWLEGPGYQVLLDVYPLTTVDARGEQHDGDLRTRIVNGWWPQFLTLHNEGEIHTFVWPKKGKYLTLPAPPEITIVAPDGKRPPEMDYAALEDKKAVERVKKARIGKEEASDAYRGSLGGNRVRAGKDVEARWFWKTTTHAYELRVLLWGDAVQALGPKVQKLLDSLELTEK
jgi:hypothetical protein